MKQIEIIAKIAAALSDPIRVQILIILAQGRDSDCLSVPHPQLPHAICPYVDVRPKLGNIAVSKLAYHLKELRAVMLIQVNRLVKPVSYLVYQESVMLFQDAVKAVYLSSKATPVLNEEPRRKTRY